MIPIYKPSLSSLEKKYLNQCLKTGWISSSGNFVNEFENAFADFMNTKYALSTSNGTSALHLLLLSAGITSPDEIIIPDFTFISTALSATYNRAIITPVDVDKDTWNINPDLIEKAITQKTKAILPVDIYGVPVDIKAIKKIAKKHNLKILQDSAEAFGAEINGKKVGTEALGAIFSFYGNKTITTGEGGMLITNSKNIFEKAKMLRDYGRKSKKSYTTNEIGFNYRMTNLQASIGLAQLQRVKPLLQRKKEIKSLYVKYLSNVPGIIFQKIAKGFSESAWLISILIDPKISKINKDQLRKTLLQNGIETRDFFPPIHSQPIYRSNPNLIQILNFPHASLMASKFQISNSLYRHGLSLPSYPDLKNSEIKFICNIIAQTIKQ